MVVAARGTPEEACHLGRQALGSDRLVPSNIWRAVFNREIDPFVATTQKKMNLRGDFAKISKWYSPCSRIFELLHLLC